MSTIREIKQYQATDGTCFNTKEEAEQYEEMLQNPHFKKLQERVEKLEAVRKSVNVHEKQIDELQTRSENVPDLDIQLSWIGHLCRFWDYDKQIESTYAILDDINVWCEHPYRKSNGNQYKHCEPVKPDDPIIYKGGDNE